jgi:metallo-beta-lactamase class B
MKRIMAIAATVTLLQASVSAAGQSDDPLFRPVASDYAVRWLKPQQPRRIFGNTYLVGFAGLNIGLIRTSAGLILIDGGLPQGVREVEANIRRLGFEPRQVKFILSTEPHYDHASGIAALAHDTGATVVASGWAARSLMSGKPIPDDPQAALLLDFPAVANVRIVGDGDRLRLGDVVVTARATPGHTPGSMSWSWRSCEGRRCVDTVFAASLNPISADDYRFTDPAHAGTVAAFRRSFAKLRVLPCGLLLSAHAEQSSGDVKFAALLANPPRNPFLDAGACRAYADRFQRALDERLASERAGGS